MAVSDVSQKYDVILRKFKNFKHQNILDFNVWLIVPITPLILQNCHFGLLAAKISCLHFRPFWSNVTDKKRYCFRLRSERSNQLYCICKNSELMAGSQYIGTAM